MGAPHPREVISAGSDERRRFPRYVVACRLLIRWLECDDCEEELIRAEDMSRGGARLIVRRPLAQGEILFVQGWNGTPFETRAEVRRVYIGRDGQPRVGIAFLDAEPPENVLAAMAGAPRPSAPGPTVAP